MDPYRRATQRARATRRRDAEGRVIAWLALFVCAIPLAAPLFAGHGDPGEMALAAAVGTGALASLLHDWLCASPSATIRADGADRQP